MEKSSPDPINPKPVSEPSEARPRGTNVPIPIVVGIIALGLGIAGGLVLAEFVNKPANTAPGVAGIGEDGGKGEGSAAAMPGGGKGGGKAGGGKGGGGKGGGGKAGGKGGGGGPNPKFQLAQLISKLDTLTAKPLTIQLTPEQKKKVQEQLAGLDSREKLTAPEAEAKLNALLDSLSDHKATLMAAGFFWPGEFGGGGGGKGGGPGGKADPDDNPFKSGANNEHVKALESTLKK